MYYLWTLKCRALFDSDSTSNTKLSQASLIFVQVTDNILSKILLSLFINNLHSFQEGSGRDLEMLESDGLNCSSRDTGQALTLTD